MGYYPSHPKITNVFFMKGAKGNGYYPDLQILFFKGHSTFSQY
jgi:hypothetical protein